MSAARHFFKSGSFPGDVETDIKDDIGSAHAARRDCERNGQHELADRMAKATDEYLDELNDLHDGTWHPKHAR
ncbi:hypothetical protein ADL21_06335 [Streptomyces albus subsp. albus]|nr:hypothetical protein ADL21_06335 [Streptomyces albus subsp. albus]